MRRDWIVGSIPEYIIRRKSVTGKFQGMHKICLSPSGEKVSGIVKATPAAGDTDLRNINKRCRRCS